MLSIDINCDIGESTTLWPYNIDRDLNLLQYVSSINIACGYHAGDPDTAIRLMKAAIPLDISIGAHPSFPDREHFGRKEMHFEEKDLYRIIYEQIEFLAHIAISNGLKIQHVKPHGALYNMAANDRRLAFIFCNAVQSYDEELMIYGLSGSQIVKIADGMGMKSCNEVFADRTYQQNGELTPRASANALIGDDNDALQQVLNMIQTGTVKSTDGSTIHIQAETICIHSDGKHALTFARRIHELMKEHGIQISHPKG
jgi:UPF0271 protein